MTTRQGHRRDSHTGSRSVIGAKVYKSGSGQAVSAGVNTALTWDVERFDSHGFHDNSSNTHRLTIPSGLGGKYEVTFLCSHPGDSTGSATNTARISMIRDDAGSLLLAKYVHAIPNNIVAVSSCLTGVLELADGDWIDAAIQYAVAGTAPALNNVDIYAFFQIVRIGS